MSDRARFFANYLIISKKWILNSRGSRRGFVPSMCMLEQREVPALPSAMEQELLEWVNRFRMDPAGEFDRYFTSTAPVNSPIAGVASAVNYFKVNLSVLKAELGAIASQAPLAWNSILHDAATDHSQKMIEGDEQSHQLPGEAGLGARVSEAGYQYSYVAENIFAFATGAGYAHAGFVIDWGSGPDGMQTPRGHRNSLVNGGIKEIGISIIPESNSSTDVGPLVVTQDMGNRWTRSLPSVLGVVYADVGANPFYNAGEGKAGMTVTLKGTQGNFTTTTWASGGFQFDEVPAGTYEIGISGNGVNPSEWTRTLIVSADNVKADFNIASVPLPVRRVGFESGLQTQVMEGSTAVVSLVRTGPVDDVLEVTIQPKVSGSATNDWQNYIQIANGGKFRFEAGQNKLTVNISAVADQVRRADTVIELGLTTSASGVTVNQATKPLLVVDDDVSTPGMFEFEVQSVNSAVLENAKTATLVVKRTGGTLGKVAVPWTIRQVSGPSLKLAKPVDIVFQEGQTQAVIKIALSADDRDAKPVRVLEITLGQPKATGAVLGASARAYLSVVDNDPLPTLSRLAGRRTKQVLSGVDAVFTGALLSSTATKTDIWAVTEAGVDGLFGTTDDVQVLVKSAVYKASTKTITLNFVTPSKSAKPLNYKVKLFNPNGLANAFGVPLEAVMERTIRV